MFYENKISSRKRKNIKIKFDDFGNYQNLDNEKVSNFSDAKVHYNFKFESGCLENGYGIERLTLPTSYDNPSVQTTINFPVNQIDYLWDFHWFGTQLGKTYILVFFLDGSGNLYYFEDAYSNSMFVDTQIDFTSTPICFSYEANNSDVMVFSSFTDGIAISTGANTSILFPNEEKLLSGCFHENCFYGVLANDDNVLIYTKDLDVVHWNNVEFNKRKFFDDGGRLQKLFSFNDYVFIFRDKSIVKVYPYSVNTDLSITNMYYSSSFIIPKSIVNCGEQIIFLTKDGLYSFNGNVVSKLDVEIAKDIDVTYPDTLVGTCYHGKYFLACKINFNDNESVGCEGATYVNNAVLIYDINTKQVEIMRGVDIKDFALIESDLVSKLICTFNGSNKDKVGQFTSNGSIFGTSYKKKWTSVSSDFGYKGKTKIVKSVSLVAKENCQMTIISDKESKTISIAGSSSNQKIKLNVKGENFKVEFSSTASSQKIKVPEFDVEVLL